MTTYPALIKKLHWGIAALIALQIILGLSMEDFRPLILFHIITGILIFALAVIRLIVRRHARNLLPGRPETIPPGQWKAAKAGHIVLYILLVLTPLTGALSLLNEKLFGEVHETLVYTFIAVILGHIAMVAKHWYVEKENLLKRIL